MRKAAQAEGMGDAGPGLETKTVMDRDWILQMLPSLTRDFPGMSEVERCGIQKRAPKVGGTEHLRSS